MDLDHVQGAEKMMKKRKHAEHHDEQVDDASNQDEDKKVKKKKKQRHSRHHDEQVDYESNHDGDKKKKKKKKKHHSRHHDEHVDYASTHDEDKKPKKKKKKKHAEHNDEQVGYASSHDEDLQVKKKEERREQSEDTQPSSATLDHEKIKGKGKMEKKNKGKDKIRHGQPTATIFRAASGSISPDVNLLLQELDRDDHDRDSGLVITNVSTRRKKSERRIIEDSDISGDSISSIESVTSQASFQPSSSNEEIVAHPDRRGSKSDQDDSQSETVISKMVGWETFTCSTPGCRTILSSMKHLVAHSAVCDRPKGTGAFIEKYKCSRCPIAYQSKQSLIKHCSAQHVDPPKKLQEDYDPTCGRKLPLDAAHHRQVFHGDAGPIDAAILRNTKWLYDIKPPGSHSRTVHQIASSIRNGQGFPCFQQFSNFDHQMLAFGYGIDAGSVRTESVARAVQWHYENNTESELVQNTFSIRRSIEAHHVEYVNRILKPISMSGDLSILWHQFSHRPELSQLFLRMFIQSRRQQEVQFRLNAARKPRSAIGNATHLISWKRWSRPRWSQHVDTSAPTASAIKRAMIAYGMNSESIVPKAYVSTYTAKYGLATFSQKTGMMELRQGVKPPFTIREPCPVLVILMHGFESISASYEEFCLFSDELHALLPGTVIHLLVKQTEEMLLSYPAWFAIQDTDRIPTYTANDGEVFRIIHYLLEEVAMAIRNFDHSPLDPKLELFLRYMNDAFTVRIRPAILTNKRNK